MCICIVIPRHRWINAHLKWAVKFLNYHWDRCSQVNSGGRSRAQEAVITVFTVVYSSLDVINKAATDTIPSFCIIWSASCTVAITILQLFEMIYQDKNRIFL